MKKMHKSCMSNRSLRSVERSRPIKYAEGYYETPKGWVKKPARPTVLR